jgi:DNA polymerase-3 subunit delta
MKVRTLETLQQRLNTSDSPSAICLILCAGQSERRGVMEQVGEMLLQKKQRAVLQRALEFEEALAFLKSPSLFQEERVALAEISKEQLSLLVAYARSSIPHAHLVVGLEPSKQMKELSDLEKSGIFLLDLSTEKVQDKEQRHLHFISSFLGNKTIAPQAALSLIRRTDHEMGLLAQEMAKLLCFIGEKGEITEADVEAICACRQAQINGFKLAEALIQGSHAPPYTVREREQIFSLLPQLRYLFEVGLKITARLEKGEQIFDRNLALVRHRKPVFFKKALLALFELELKLKQNVGSPQLLFDRFCAQVVG